MLSSLLCSFYFHPFSRLSGLFLTKIIRLMWTHWIWHCVSVFENSNLEMRIWYDFTISNDWQQTNRKWHTHTDFFFIWHRPSNGTKNRDAHIHNARAKRVACLGAFQLHMITVNGFTLFKVRTYPICACAIFYWLRDSIPWPLFAIKLLSILCIYVCTQSAPFLGPYSYTLIQFSRFQIAIISES